MVHAALHVMRRTGVCAYVELSLPSPLRTARAAPKADCHRGTTGGCAARTYTSLAYASGILSDCPDSRLCGVQVAVLLAYACLAYINSLRLGTILNQAGRALCPAACGQCAAPPPPYASTADLRLLLDRPLQSEETPLAAQLNDAAARAAVAHPGLNVSALPPYAGALRLSSPYGAGPYGATATRTHAVGYLQAYGITESAPSGEWALLVAGPDGCEGRCLGGASRAQRHGALAAVACRQMGYDRGWAYTPATSEGLELPPSVPWRRWVRAATCAGDEAGVAAVLEADGPRALFFGGGGGCYLTTPEGNHTALPGRRAAAPAAATASEASAPTGAGLSPSPFGAALNLSADDSDGRIGAEQPLLVGCSRDGCADYSWALDAQLRTTVGEATVAGATAAAVVAVNASGARREGRRAMEPQVFGGLRPFNQSEWAPQSPRSSAADALSVAAAFELTRCATPPSCEVLARAGPLCEQPASAYSMPTQWLLLSVVWMPMLLYRCAATHDALASSAPATTLSGASSPTHPHTGLHHSVGARPMGANRSTRHPDSATLPPIPCHRPMPRGAPPQGAQGGSHAAPVRARCRAHHILRHRSPDLLPPLLDDTAPARRRLAVGAAPRLRRSLLSLGGRHPHSPLLRAPRAARVRLARVGGVQVDANHVAGVPRAPVSSGHARGKPPPCHRHAAAMGHPSSTSPPPLPATPNRATAFPRPSFPSSRSRRGSGRCSSGSRLSSRAPSASANTTQSTAMARWRRPGSCSTQRSALRS